MATQEQEVHLDAGGVGGLHQHDSLARDGGDRLDRAFARERVEGVEDQADMGMVGAPHRLPGLAVVVDVPAPAQGLEADGDPVGLRQLAQLVQIGGDPAHVVDGVGRDAAADQQQAGAQAAHQLELASRPVERAAAQWLWQPLEVAERLQRHDLQAERGSERAHVLRAAVEVGEVVLEDLDAVVARLGGGRELVAERARHADGGDGLLHLASPVRRAGWRADHR